MSARPSILSGGLSGLIRSPGIYLGPSEREQLDHYDPTSMDFLSEGTGRRVAYSDFTTIDWIHDTTKERVRLRQLFKMRGYRGLLTRAWDASKAWIVVILMGRNDAL